MEPSSGRRHSANVENELATFSSHDTSRLLCAMTHIAFAGLRRTRAAALGGRPPSLTPYTPLPIPHPHLPTTSPPSNRSQASTLKRMLHAAAQSLLAPDCKPTPPPDTRSLTSQRPPTASTTALGTPAHLEKALSRHPPRVHHALGDALAVKLGKLLHQMVVLGAR